MFTKRLQKPVAKLDIQNLGPLLVYEIRLHAVQFGYNWMRKNSEDSQNCQRKFFEL